MGGPVLPSSNFKKFNFCEFLDGRLSWFTSLDQNTSHYVYWPYHLPTCNLSIRVNKFFQKKIRFNEKIETGEDADLFDQIRKFELKAYFDNNCKVKHIDRKDFISFFNHHFQWGRHQYHNIFKLKKKKTKVIVFNFLSIYLPIISYVTNFFCFKKMVFKKFFIYFSITYFYSYFCSKIFSNILRGLSKLL